MADVWCKSIRIGPSLPAFITPSILKMMLERFNIMPITIPEEDLKAIMKQLTAACVGSKHALEPKLFPQFFSAPLVLSIFFGLSFFDGDK